MATIEFMCILCQYYTKNFTYFILVIPQKKHEVDSHFIDEEIGWEKVIYPKSHSQ